MAQKLDHGIAAHVTDARANIDDYCRMFVAPASPELGGTIAVGLVSAPINRHSGSREAGILAAEAVQEFLLTHPAENALDSISQSIAVAHAAVAALEHKPDAAPVGAFLLVAIVADDRLFIGRVGDGCAYLLRDNTVRAVAANHSWLDEAFDSWQARPGDIHNFGSTAERQPYVGQPGPVTPEIAPVELLWPGDELLLCSGRLAAAVGSTHIRDALATRAPQVAAGRLVDSAVDAGENDSVAALVIGIPDALRPAPQRYLPSNRPSWAVRGLIVGNILVILVIGVLLLRGRGLAGPLVVAPTIEVAKPLFIPIPTATPLPLPTIDTGDPFAFPPGYASPVLAPSVTPLPTFTPAALPANWRQPDMKAELPANGFLFSGPDASVILAWDGTSDLPEDVFYVVTIRKWLGSTLEGESRNWTKSNRIRLDPSFYAAADTTPRRFGSGAPLTAAVSKFEWFVTLYRLTLIQPNGLLDGVPIGAPSATLTFFWGPPAQAAPTRVYGSDASNDPFFRADRAREASFGVTASPISAGMGVLSLVASALAGWPKMRSTLRRRRRLRL